MKTTGIIEEPMDLKGMAQRRNASHNYKLSGSECGCRPIALLLIVRSSLWKRERGKQEKSQSPEMCVGLKDVTANSSDSRPVFHQSHPLIVFRSKYIFVFCFLKTKTNYKYI